MAAQRNLHAGTPEIAVRGNQGQTIRHLSYNRGVWGEALDERIGRTVFNALGQAISSQDARFFAEDAGTLNLKRQASLAGRPLHTVNADAGGSHVFYDIEGRPVWRRDARCTVQRFEYDLLGRLTRLSEQLQGQTRFRIREQLLYGEDETDAKALNLRGRVACHYDTAGRLDNRAGGYGLQGHLVGQRRQLLAQNTVSDWAGADVSAWMRTLEGPLYTTRWQYDANGQLLRLWDAMGHQQRYAYDVAGNLKRRWVKPKDGLEAATLVSLSYSATGRPLREEDGNGVVTEYIYEPHTLRLVNMQTSRATRSDRKTVLQSLRYEYDPVGNITALFDDAQRVRFFRNQKVQPDRRFSYDALYQLIRATGRENASQSPSKTDSPGALPLDTAQYTTYTRRYTYDRGGNLTRIRHAGHGASFTRNLLVSSNSNHAMRQVAGLAPDQVRGCFDACGNQKQLDSGPALEWDGLNQLASVTTIVRDGDPVPDDHESYLYDSTGARVRKTSRALTRGTIRQQEVIYLPGLELRTSGSGDTPAERLEVLCAGEAGRAQAKLFNWTHGPSAEAGGARQWRYSLDDCSGTSQMELDDAGDIVAREEYYPYGGTAVLSARSESEVAYKYVRYSGKERDATGLYYYGFRYYQPWLGRWLSADPGGIIDGLNLYRMVRNNPVTRHDPNGLSPDYAGGNRSLLKEFKRGDILYGLDAPRGKMLKELGKIGITRKSTDTRPPKNLFSKIKQSFRKPKQKVDIVIQNDITNTVWSPSDPTRYSEAREIKQVVNDYARATGFRDFLSAHEKYNVMNDRLAAQLQAAGDTGLAKALWKKTSKAGLEYQLFKRKSPVHFLIDIIGDDIGTVASKTDHGTSITSSELRWLFRHKDVQDLRQNLNFWRNGEFVPIDEVLDEEKWRGYSPKRRYS